MKQTLWKNLLNLSYKVAAFDGVIEFCYCPTDGTSAVQINPTSTSVSSCGFFIFFSKKHINTKDASVFLIKNLLEVEITHPGKLSPEEIQFMTTYLPYCFLSSISKQKKRAIAITHFAQSLDGKIATTSGDSKWIGNEENLNHAHRMRALCDAIIIGNRTLTADHPQLTVRRVEGKNPIRVVIGNSKSDVSCLLSCCSETVLIIGKEKSERNGQIHYIQLSSSSTGRINCQNILQTLFAKNIYSVYIEGGAITTSNFLKDNAVDILQLHISPLIFGSGKGGIILPEIETVKESINFTNFQFQPIGNTMMFVGSLERV